MSDRYTVTIGPVSIKDADGNAFFDFAGSQWSNVPQMDVVELEAIVHEAVGKLIGFGRAKAQSKGNSGK